MTTTQQETINWGMHRGSDPALLGEEILYYIGEHITRHPRSQQAMIGPSEVGVPCSRKLGYKLLDVPEINRRGPGWKPTIGTAVHSWLEQALSADITQGRFLVECEVEVGEVGGKPIIGHADAYDMVTDTVIDHKIVGPTQLKKYRAHGPGPQYRTQAHLYGRGFQIAGANVATVMIVFYPRNGELSDTYVWFEPYDEQVALDALTRLGTIDTLTSIGGIEALPLLPTADDWCHYCPWFRQGSTDVRDACPGDPSHPARANPPAALTLVG